ncbi:uncharacterized protein [Amphiura filiformis]|uniref:uncharacterized protein isoform X2 n=1 Tax=Amphiura filiformis TaxID=82378 RepID=UPI003B225804
MGVAEVFYWSWAVLLMHVVANSIGEAGDGVLVGSTQYPFDEETQKCIEQMANPDVKIGAWFRDCRERYKGLVAEDYEDFSSLFNDTMFNPEETLNDGSILSRQNGSSVTLKCGVVNRGDAPVKWIVTPKRRSKDGKYTFLTAHDVVSNGRIMTPFDKSFQMEGDYNRTFHLRINPIRPRHAGVYVCQIYLDTQILQTSVELIVNVAASIKEIRPTRYATNTPRISTNPKFKMFYNETDRVELFCDAVGMPTPNVTWKKADGTMISTVANLVLENIRTEDTGTYTCVAFNFETGPAEKKVEIVVQYQPRVTVRKADIREPEGAYVWLECYVDAKPRAEYRWIKDNRTIRADDVGITENPKSTKVPLLCFQDKIRLIIISLNPESDYGRYYCVATNLLGNSTGMIDVSGKPRKPKIISDPVGNRKHKFNLIWNHGDNERREDPRSIEVNSYEIQYYGWWVEIRGDTRKVIFSHGNLEPFKETVEVAPGEYEKSFVLNDLRRNTTYNVSLFGRNKYGDGEVAKFQFSTSAEDPQYIPTTEPSATIDNFPDTLELVKCWPEDNCIPRSSASHNTAHLCLNLSLVVVFIRVLFL